MIKRKSLGKNREIDVIINTNSGRKKNTARNEGQGKKYIKLIRQKGTEKKKRTIILLTMTREEELIAEKYNYRVSLIKKHRQGKS